MQYSYNINTSTYNRVLAKFNLTKSDSHTFHGTFRFEENGELYSLMGGYSGYFTILAKNLEEENLKKILSSNKNCLTYIYDKSYIV